MPRARSSISSGPGCSPRMRRADGACARRNDFTTPTKENKVSAPRTRRGSRVSGMAGVSLMRRYAGDGGRSSVVAVQAEATNHPQTAAVKSCGGKRCGKRRACERVRCDPMKANVSKPWMTCRKLLDDIKSGSVTLARDEPGGCLFIDQVVSGIYAARAWVGLLHGTWEPVVLRDDQLVASGLRLAVSGKVSSGRNREGRILVAGHRGGPARSSVEGPVMGLERRGRAVQARLLVNHEVCGMS